MSNPFIAEHTILEHKVDTFIIDEPRLIFISVKGKEGTLELVAQPGEKINISGKLKRYYSAHYSPYNFSDLTVTGAEAQEEYTTMIRRLSAYRDSLSCVPEEYKDISLKYNEAVAKNDITTIRAMASGSFAEQDYLQRLRSNQDQIYKYIHDMVCSYRESYMAPLLMLRLYDNLDERHRPIYLELYPEAKQTFYGEMVRKYVFPRSENGKIAPTLELIDENDNKLTCNFVNKNAEYTLVEFWASFCAPCLRHMPFLASLYDKYHAKGFNIVAISTDANTPEWKQVLKSRKFPWTDNYFDVNHNAYQLFKFDKIPFNVLIDSHGMIVAENLHDLELSDYLDSFFTK